MIGNHVYPQGYRGFESRPLRCDSLMNLSAYEFFLSAGDPPGCAPARHILVLVITVDKWITSSLDDVLVFLDFGTCPWDPILDAAMSRRPRSAPRGLVGVDADDRRAVRRARNKDARTKRILAGGGAPITPESVKLNRKATAVDK